MNYLLPIQEAFVDAMQELYKCELSIDDITISSTKKEFTGDYTILLFPFTKQTKLSPETIGQQVGDHLLQSASSHIKSCNVIKGFLNLEMQDQFWITQLLSIIDQAHYGMQAPKNEKVLVEYSSPNTNKPLHLGHIRNILLGSATASILKAAGYEVVKVQIINDRGIAICKSMLAWQKYGDGKSPQTTQMKSDHFVGEYYVLFEQKFQEEYKAWQSSEEAKHILENKNVKEEVTEDFFKKYKNEYFNSYSTLGKEAREMLHLWESNDSATVELWQKMNAWVYEGFNITYQKLKVDFDKNYYESNTYLLGKKAVDVGLNKGIFVKDDDSSVWVDLTDIGMDRKIVLRSDGTSVYMTQDLGTAMQRYDDFKVNKMIYTVADEQDYHFKVLFEILKRLGEPYAEGLYHLSYGMVDLTTGKMKSREGTVVDADDLVDDVIAEAKRNSVDRGKLGELPTDEQDEIFEKIGMAALKYYILKVHPKKRMTFDPTESLDMQGQTGPYIQNAFVRVQSLFRKNNDNPPAILKAYSKQLKESEIDMIKLLLTYPASIEEAARTYDPSCLANFCYALAKSFHKFYNDVRILNAETIEEKEMRLLLSKQIGATLQHGMGLLGVEMPDLM